MWQGERGQNIVDGGSFYDTYATADGRYVAVGPVEPQFSADDLDAQLDTDDLPSYLSGMAGASGRGADGEVSRADPRRMGEPLCRHRRLRHTGAVDLGGARHPHNMARGGSSSMWMDCAYPPPRRGSTGLPPDPMPPERPRPRCRLGDRGVERIRLTIGLGCDRRSRGWIRDADLSSSTWHAEWSPGTATVDPRIVSALWSMHSGPGGRLAARIRKPHHARDRG